MMAERLPEPEWRGGEPTEREVGWVGFVSSNLLLYPLPSSLSVRREMSRCDMFG